MLPNTTEFEIRNLNTDDADQYNALLRYAFQITEQELTSTGWHDDEIKQSKFPILKRADVLGCFDHDALVSQIAVYPLKMNIYGAVYPVGFVTSVCTYPEYSGHGIMKRLMHQSLEPHAPAPAAPRPAVSLFDPAVPQNGLGDHLQQDHLLRQGPPDSRKGVQRRAMSAGCSWDNEDFTQPRTRSSPPQRTAACSATPWPGRNTGAGTRTTPSSPSTTTSATSPAGYMVYLIKDDIMHIKEMIYLTREAHEGLWEYIRAHDSMIDEVRGSSYFSDPIAFELEDGDIR